jgi:branched-chain amino acid transport system permease protein
VSPLVLSLLTQAAILALLATSVGCLVRMTGRLSFGHASFYGLAMYLVVLPAQAMKPELAVLLALAVPTLLAFLLGLVAMRTAGTAFSMLMLAVGQGFHELVSKARPWTGGDEGVTLALPQRMFGLPSSWLQQPVSAFALCAAVLAATLLGLHLLSRSRFGRLVDAIRDNEERVRFLGHATVLPRALSMALSGFIAAVAGVLSALYNGFVSPDAFHWSLSGLVLVMAMVGGASAVWGPAVGALAFILLKDTAGAATEHWRAIVGVALIVFTVRMPSGLAGVLALRRSARR